MDHPELLLNNPPASAPVDMPEHWRRFAPDLPEDKVLFSELVPGGGHWSYRLPRGTTLRITALDAGANLSLVLYSAQEKLERYNMPDSLKAQHTAHYTRGHVLMSDMGRAMASITADSLDWHDPLGLLLDNRLMHEKYGDHAYQANRNGMTRSGRDGLLIEIGKYGLAKRDLVAPVNFFSKITVDAEGRFRYVPDHAQAGDFVDLRMDMDVLVAFSTAPHPLNPEPAYPASKVGLAVWRSGPALADDYCRGFRPENARALHNTDMLYLT
ncbi:MAG: urea carboxylase-associated family protein [Gammaproteobacteria bacterium]|nr:urea carboxylase-associated family protein [Gammaproteobacteria bacterium]MBU1409221.1 urea carboxylase-associated family protein [Gammaproteobacteria bacterium]MBU1531117.1 urea carboxylase-associated family protein [Gammaproteobacteria bacterium]